MEYQTHFQNALVLCVILWHHFDEKVPFDNSFVENLTYVLLRSHEKEFTRDRINSAPVKATWGRWRPDFPAVKSRDLMELPNKACCGVVQLSLAPQDTQYPPILISIISYKCRLFLP